MAAAAGAAEADVLVRPVARGEVLASADFERGYVPAATARFALRGADAAGKEARRALPAGASVRASDIGPPTLVRRGEGVTLVMRSGRLTITAPGRALGDGAAGGAVRVVNLATDRTLDARVMGPGAAEVDAP
jgi:flagella basal body P-ring formation protein FlgA